MLVNGCFCEVILPSHPILTLSSKLPCQEPSLYCRKPSVMVTKTRQNRIHYEALFSRTLWFPHCQKQPLSEGEGGIIAASPRTTANGCRAFHLLPFTGVHTIPTALSLARTINCYGDGGWDVEHVIYSLSFRLFNISPGRMC